MVRAIVLAISMVLFCANFAAAADVSPHPTEIDTLANQYFSDLRDHKVADAWHFALKSSEGTIGNGGMDNVISSTEAVIKTVGNVEDWHLIKLTVISDTMYRGIYFVNCEHIPLFFTIQFYNNNNSWNIIDIQLNTYNAAKSQGYLD